MPRGVAQFGSATGLGPVGRGFKSCHPDHYKNIWAFSSVGQSIRLITGRSRVQVPEGPPFTQFNICPFSSVGRAGDWKSPCLWFDSGSGHHKNRWFLHQRFFRGVKRALSRKCIFWLCRKYRIAIFPESRQKHLTKWRSWESAMCA